MAVSVQMSQDSPVGVFPMSTVQVPMATTAGGLPQQQAFHQAMDGHFQVADQFQVAPMQQRLVQVPMQVQQQPGGAGTIPLATTAATLPIGLGSNIINTNIDGTNNAVAATTTAAANAQPPSPTNASTVSNNAGSPPSDIRTLFVAGMPYDASDRELYLLFGSTEGYDKSMIVRKEGGKRPYGFVNYLSMAQAMKAQAKLDGFQWDPSDPLRLKVELSRRNTPDWFTTTCASQNSITKRLCSLPKNPKTLYVTGVPETVSKELFDAFITTNFVGQVAGMRFTLPTEKKSSFAFVGFNSHDEAKNAMERLEGYVWSHEGTSSTLHATFANTEWTDKPQTRN